MTPLATMMLDRADQDGLDEHHTLRVLAYQLEFVNNRNESAKNSESYAMSAEFYLKNLLGCWTRALLAWCDYTGEGLV